MNEIIKTHIFGWLRSLNLPDPDYDYSIAGMTIDIAFPEDTLGIIIGHTFEEISEAGWQIWVCEDEGQVYKCLVQIAKQLDISPIYSALDFAQIEQMISHQLFDNALEILEQLEQHTPESHPDIMRLKELKKEARRGKRSLGSSQVQELSSSRFVGTLKADISRFSSLGLPDFNLFNFFDSEFTVLETVDAVWVMSARNSKHEMWAATAAGHSAASFDPEFETYSTELDLLDKFIENLGRTPSFVWDTRQIVPKLQAWHYRSKGRGLPDNIQLFDLRALCLIAFPQTQRTDQPEALCQELNLNYTTANGIGSPLAAMFTLLRACIKRLNQLDERLGSALYHILQRTYLNGVWLNVFLPYSVTLNGFDGFVEYLVEHYSNISSPIQTSRGRRDIDIVKLDDFYKEGGYLAKSREGTYHRRQGQVDFSFHVQAALTDENPYLLEAGTGVGKTIGYLVPLLISDKRAFVATKTKNLQDQAWNKDIPAVLRAFDSAGIARTVSMLKGKSNYFNPEALEDSLDDLDAIPNFEVKVFAFAALLHWTVLTHTGDLSEIEELDPELIHLFDREKMSPTDNGRWSLIDPYRRAVEAAKNADVVLVNQSLVFALAKLGQPEESEINVIVFDEAHNIEDVATEALTLNFDAWALQNEIKKLLDRDSRQRIRGLLATVFEHERSKSVSVVQEFRSALFSVETGLSNWCASSALRFAELSKMQPEPDTDTPMLFDINSFFTDELVSRSSELNHTLIILSTSLSQVIEKLSALPWIPQQLKNRLQGSLDLLWEHIRDSQEALGSILVNNQEDILWGEANCLDFNSQEATLFQHDEEWRGVLHSTPLDVASWLKLTLPTIYEHRIYVSATLATGKNFDSTIRRLGLSEDNAKTAIFPSPYKLREQALVAIPTDMPYPQTSYDTLYVESLANHIADLAKISKGFALVLFTSRRIMNEVAPRLEAILLDTQIKVLAQNAHNRSAIVERFANAPQQGEQLVLLGMRAFWEGVDFPGALKILVITRLPFDFSGHPIAIARRQYHNLQSIDNDYFHDVVIPTTLLHLRQMAGRLIRREQDRGVCVIADPRIQAKLYGRYMLKQLLDSQRAVGRRAEIQNHIQEFLYGSGEVGDLFDLENKELFEDESHLSHEQLSIIHSQAQRIVVEATAGAGKTRTLIERIVNLINSGKAKPDEILLLTYTRKAQDVMSSRLEASLEPHAFLSLNRFILTYHQFAARVIRSYQQNETRFINENQAEQTNLFNTARYMAGLSEAELSNEDAQSVISFAQNGLINETELEEFIPQLSPFLAKLAKFFLEYVKQLRQSNLLDYGEAIVQAVRTLRDSSEVRQRWSSKFKWIFCDEYQDTTPAQAALIHLIAQNANILVVGDSAQTIYSWQGADPNNLHRFGFDFGGAVTFSLSKNYRSFPNAVKTAEYFLRNSQQYAGMPIQYDERREDDSQKVYYLSSSDEYSEARAILQIISNFQNTISEGSHHSVGILARKWSLLNIIEEECIRQGIAYKFEGDPSQGLITENGLRQHIIRAVDLMSAAKSSTIAGDSPDGRIIAELRNGKITSADELLTRIAEVGIVIPDELLTKFERLKYLLQGRPIDVLGSMGRADSSIVLSTIHGQKGEEFDTVFVVGLEQNNTPNQPPNKHKDLLIWRKTVQQHSRATWRASLSLADIQEAYEKEEARIFYVAMTRAVNNLIICHSDKRGVKSEFLELAYQQQSVGLASNPSDIFLIPVQEYSKSLGYKMEGRQYLTNAGIRVRSKSELILANEFHRRGMYFVYEETIDQVSNLLPDFTFPDYGGIIVEHLGMLDKADYRKRWEVKKARYSKEGITFFSTLEDDIKNPQKSVDNLQQIFQSILPQEQAKSVTIIESIRRQSELSIGQAIGNIESGLLRINNHPQFIALQIMMSSEPSIVLLEQVDGISVTWQSLTIGDFNTWVAIPSDEE